MPGQLFRYENGEIVVHMIDGDLEEFLKSIDSFSGETNIFISFPDDEKYKPRMIVNYAVRDEEASKGVSWHSYKTRCKWESSE